jgi:dihydroorotate dehydrogenase electron transfer subunit
VKIAQDNLIKLMRESNLHYKAGVIANLNICTGHYLLTLKEGALAREIVPGQFVNLRIDRRADLTLRRPFSVARVRPDLSELDIVYQVVGKGTRAMADLRPGQEVDLLGPLGQGFHLPEIPSCCLLVGGGCGVAPLWGLAENLSKQESRVIAFLGFRSSKKVFGEQDFRKLGAEVTVTTDDGSYGLKGFVSDHLENALRNPIDRVYVCGPPPMLKAVLPMVRKANLKGEVSLEERMGCGYGVCLSCVVDVMKGGSVEKQRVCKEGPVFGIDKIVL